jgi:peptide-methionine (S)-S-oxide reductase
MATILPDKQGLEVATLGGGCFWCLEAVFEQLRGVVSVVSGYAGGHVPNPTYEQVCGKRTGHAEVVQITFDPSVIPYRDLLEVFFATHDPTTKDRQGNDVGPQYRSTIFYHSDEQRKAAEELIAELTAGRVFAAPIVTEVAPLTTFYPAEDYHQQYFRSNPAQPYCTFVVAPKVAKFRKQYADRLK